MIQRLTTSKVRRAFTLIEVLIASAILAGAVLALTMPFSLAAEHQRTDAVQTIGATLAAQRMERLLTLTYSQVLASNGQSEAGSQITDLAGRPLNDPSLADFTVAVSVNPVQVAPGDDAGAFAVATVTVSHPDVPPVSVARLFSE